MARHPCTLLAALLLLAAPAVAPGQTRTDGSPQRLGAGTSGAQVPPGMDVNKLLEEFSRSRSRQQQGPLAPLPSRDGEGEPVHVLPPDSETLTARGQFEEAAKTLLRDGRLDEDRRRFLLTKAAELGLDRREAMDLAEKIAEERRKISDFFLAQVRAREGKLTAEDQRYLEQQGRDLGLDPWETRDMIGLGLERYRKREVYRSVVKELLADGILIASEEQHLEEKRKELSLTRDEHREILAAEKEKRLERARDVFSDIREEGRARALPDRELELYGRNLFQASGPGAFRPATGLAPPDHYRVGTGDTFEVFLWGRLEASYFLPVDSEGKVQFPQVGSVKVGGLTYAEAKAVLKQRAEAITGVNAAVTMAETRSVQVFVVGEVERPGAVTLTPLSTVVHALTAAGGPTPIGSLRGVALRRGGSLAASLDLYDFLREGQTRGDRPLENGDVIVVPRAQRLVRLHGQVKSPAIYELREGEGLRRLLEYAGGLAAEANAGRIQVERAVRNEQRVVLDVAVGELPGDVPLQDGDLVRVFPLAPEIRNEVGLFGHVHRPGTYAHEEGMRVADLIRGTEALKPEVDLSYAVVLREDPESRERTVIPFHLGGALRDDREQNLPLWPRDEVYVFQASRFRPPLRAQASGEVRKPGLYRIEKGARVSDLVRLAGGLLPDAFLPQAEVLRYLPDRTRRTHYVDLGKAMEGDGEHDLALADEDQLVVHPAWSQRPREVALIEGEIQGARDEAVRQGRTVRQRLAEMLDPGPPAPDPRAEGNGAAQEAGQPDDALEGVTRTQVARAAGPVAVEIPLTRGMTVRDLVFKAGGLTKDAYLPVATLYRTDPVSKETAIRTFHLGKALEGDPEENPVLQDLDHVTVHSAYEFAPVRRVLISGMVSRPGEYPYAANMRVRDLVLAAGGMTEEAYQDEAEIVRAEVLDGEVVRTRTISIALGQAMAGDPEANLVLQPRDRVFVKTIPDWRETRQVLLSGEVLFPGTYHVAKGERLSSVLNRAGGFTPEAYLRGAIFTRERARQLQQQRLDELRERLQQQILRVASQEVQGALSAEDVEAHRQYLIGQQALVQKLKETRATGRVVVKLLPPEQMAGTEWDIPLEDSDTLTVPSTPQTVSVVGQVYNPTSLLWEASNRPVHNYLFKTGGPTPDADAKDIYVVRADGTVVSANSLGQGSWWSRGIHDLDLYPGDTVLVPEKVFRINYMKGIRDITQILYQIAITAGVAVVLF